MLSARSHPHLGDAASALRLSYGPLVGLREGRGVECPRPSFLCRKGASCAGRDGAMDRYKGEWVMKKSYFVTGVIVIVVLFLVGIGWGRKAPIVTSFRPSWLDNSGLVLQVHNTSPGCLSCAMYAENTTCGQNARHVFSVAPFSVTEIGLLEAGWSFKTGEKIVIMTEGYRSVTIKVP